MLTVRFELNAKTTQTNKSYRPKTGNKCRSQKIRPQGKQNIGRIDRYIPPIAPLVWPPPRLFH